jgi:DnaJ-class molecular chaperone
MKSYEKTSKWEMNSFTSYEMTELAGLHSPKRMLSLSEKSERERDVMRSQTVKASQNKCPYCRGKGYFQLLLGGSETCEHCQGSGKTND